MNRKISFSCGALQRKYSDKDALRIAKEIGADAVDFDLSWYTCDGSMENSIYLKSDEEIIDYFNSIRDYAGEIGIEICQTHGRLNGYNPHDEKLNDVFLKNSRLDCLATSALGCRYVVFHTVNSTRFGADTPGELMHKYNYDMFASILPFAKKYGVRIATETFGDCAKYNCCDFFGNIHEFLAGYNRVVSEEDFKDYFVTCADTGHSNKAMRFGNPTPADVIRMLGSSLKVLHLNDNDTLTDQHKPLFTGTIDWDDVFAALDEVGYDGVLNMELNLSCFGKGIEVETAAFAITCLKNYLK